MSSFQSGQHSSYIWVVWLAETTSLASWALKEVPPGMWLLGWGRLSPSTVLIQQPSTRKNQEHLQSMFVQGGQVQLTLCVQRETSRQVGRSCAAQALSHSTWSCPVSLQPLFVCSQIGFGGAGKQSISCFALTGLGSLVIPKHRSLHSACHREDFVFPHISDHKSPQAHKKSKEFWDSALQKRVPERAGRSWSWSWALCFEMMCSSGMGFPWHSKGRANANASAGSMLEKSSGFQLWVSLEGRSWCGSIIRPFCCWSCRGQEQMVAWSPFLIPAPDKNLTGLVPLWRTGVCQRPCAHRRGGEGRVV